MKSDFHIAFWHIWRAGYWSSLLMFERAYRIAQRLYLIRWDGD